MQVRLLACRLLQHDHHELYSWCALPGCRSLQGTARTMRRPLLCNGACRSGLPLLRRTDRCAWMWAKKFMLTLRCATQYSRTYKIVSRAAGQGWGLYLLARHYVKKRPECVILSIVLPQDGEPIAVRHVSGDGQTFFERCVEFFHTRNGGLFRTAS